MREPESYCMCPVLQPHADASESEIAMLVALGVIAKSIFIRCDRVQMPSDEPLPLGWRSFDKGICRRICDMAWRVTVPVVVTPHSPLPK